jgi:hypothetical protein
MSLHTPDSVTDALTLVDEVDAAFLGGLARPTDASATALTALAAGFAGTPMHGTLTEATEALAGGEVRDHHLLALAAARTSLLGACHDALVAHAAEVLGRPVSSGTTDHEAVPTEVAHKLTGVRHWLTEVATAGLGRLEEAVVLPASSLSDALHDEPRLAGLAALLSGFTQEVLEQCPTALRGDLPVRRWVDLWSHALLATQVLTPRAAGASVSGTLTVLGGDLRHHDNLVSLEAWALLDGRFVRVTVSAWKVDAIWGAEAWKRLAAVAPELVEALATPRELQVEDMTLLPTGDLLWTGTATPGDPVEPWAVDLSAPIPVQPPRRRHPIHVAIPTTVSTATDHGIGLDLSRTSPYADFDGCASATDGIGLLRWDGAWTWQPLAMTGKRKRKTFLFGVSGPIVEAAKSKTDALAVLSERASKLLRA